MARLLLLLLALAAVAAVSADGVLEPSSLDRRKDKNPWFCHGKDCPRFETLKQRGPFAVRRYERSTWATVCARDTQQEEALWHGVAELFEYIKGDNKKDKKLFGGTPFARYVLVEPEHMLAWNATAHNETSLECVHKIVCVAYFLPNKYQGGGRRPPKPESKHVRIVRVPKWTAFVKEFEGFPTRIRCNEVKDFSSRIMFIFEYVGLLNVLKFNRVPFNWRVAMGFVYDPPFAKPPQHNEVLVPAGRPKHDAMYDQLFGLPAVDLYDPPSGGVERALAKAEAESSADMDEILAGLEGQTALE
ncbi:hypothetical protein N2152v2_010327 [Parachlorella kessleri]